MNDLGLQSPIEESQGAVRQQETHGANSSTSSSNTQGIRRAPAIALSTERYVGKIGRVDSRFWGARGTIEDEYDEEAEDFADIYQSTLWWFASTACPLIAGTFGPIANLFSVCALSKTWRITTSDGSNLPDPRWLNVLNACSLLVSLIANMTLLLNFARRIRYHIAQPITISLWYLSCLLLLVPVGLIHNSHTKESRQPGTVSSQSYYYGLISGCLYFVISTLLLLSTLGATVLRKYPASFASLTGPQRTLMLQTISFALYLALGAGVFGAIEDWGFADGVYWADYTLLTIGLGTDFPLTTTLGRMLLLPYSALGITLIGLVVSSVRALVLERVTAKVVRRHLGKEREKWRKSIEKLRRQAMTSDETTSAGEELWLRMQDEKLLHLTKQLTKHSRRELKAEDYVGHWNRAEFEVMRHIETNAENARRLTSLGASFLVILVVWFGGSVIFWVVEHDAQHWSYSTSIYFTYTTLITVGYGDFYPTSSAGKPFFVLWSLISVPAMTVFISNMGDTVVRWVQDATVWVSSWTILPERQQDLSGRRRRRDWRPWSRTTTIVDPGRLEKQDADVIRSTSHHSQVISSGPADNRGRAQATGEEADQKAARRLPQPRSESTRGTTSIRQRSGPGSLASKLAHEISILSKDVGEKPPKKYSWREWDRWLILLGERDVCAGPESAIQPQGSAPPKFSPQNEGDQRSISETLRQGRAATISNSDTQMPGQESTKWSWTWLGDKGPLFSRLTETEWVIDKLCFRLERMEDESEGFP